MAVCLFAGVLANAAIPRSNGSATNALSRVERSLGPGNETPSTSPLPIEVRSVSCYGGPRTDSYWEEGVFNVEIRKLEGTVAVMTDESTAQLRSRNLAPKSWEVYASDFLLNDQGKASVNFTTPCYRANRGAFYPSLEARYSALLSKFRARIDKP
jgi:hypothetical protein